MLSNRASAQVRAFEYYFKALCDGMWRNGTCGVFGDWCLMLSHNLFCCIIVLFHISGVGQKGFNKCSLLAFYINQALFLFFLLLFLSDSLILSRGEK